MDRRRLVVGAVVVALAAAAGAGLAGLGPDSEGGGPDDGRAAGTATEVTAVRTAAPATDRRGGTPARTDDPDGVRSPVTESGRPATAREGERAASTPAERADESSGGGPDRRQTAVGSATAGDRPTAGNGERTPTPTRAPAVRTPAPEPFAVRIERIEPCGQFCRDVTASLTNRQATAATNVVVTTRLYPGNRTDGRPVWTGEIALGTLAPGATATTTDRVQLSVFDSFAVADAGGWVTVSTTIRSDQRTVTVTERRQVT